MKKKMKWHGKKKRENWRVLKNDHRCFSNTCGKKNEKVKFSRKICQPLHIGALKQKRRLNYLQAYLSFLDS